MVGLVFGVVVATVVVWKRERYGGLGIGFCWDLNPRLWWWWWVGRLGCSTVMVGDWLLNSGGGWLRERHRVREIERKREK